MLIINEILEWDLDSNQQIDMLRQLLEENYEELSKDEINIDCNCNCDDDCCKVKFNE